MEFLESKSLSLNKAGYLISTASKKPVTHEAFVAEQKAAEYLVKLSEAIKDKNFKQTACDDLQAIIKQVKAEMSNNQRTYVEAPIEPKSKVIDELVNYALNFEDFHVKSEKTEQINKLMNEFNSINDVETIGDYFSEGVVKLNKIYTIKEILEAVKIQVEKLN